MTAGRFRRSFRREGTGSGCNWLPPVSGAGRVVCPCDRLHGDFEFRPALGANPALPGEERLDVQLVSLRAIKSNPHGGPLF